MEISEAAKKLQHLIGTYLFGEKGFEDDHAFQVTNFIQRGFNAETAPLKAHLDRVVNAVPEAFRIGRPIGEAVELMQQGWDHIECSLKAEIERVKSELESEKQAHENLHERYRDISVTAQQGQREIQRLSRVLGNTHSKHALEIERLKKELEEAQNSEKSWSNKWHEETTRADRFQKELESTMKKWEQHAEQLCGERDAEKSRADAAEKERDQWFKLCQESGASLAAMREAILKYKQSEWGDREIDYVPDAELFEALSTDAGKGWMSLEDAAHLTSALEKCVRDIDFWSETLSKEWKGFDGQLYDCMEQAKRALSKIKRSNPNAGTDFIRRSDTLSREPFEDLNTILAKYLVTGRGWDKLRTAYLSAQAELDRTKGGDAPPKPGLTLSEWLELLQQVLMAERENRRAK